MRRRIFMKPEKTTCFAMTSIIFLLVFISSARAEVRVEKDLVFDVRGTAPMLGDMYIPDGKDPMPGILFFHGGGFVAGTKDYEPLPRFIKWFAERGYVVFSANYRLIKDGGVFPNNVKDAKCALGWFRKNAAKYGVDPDRIGVMGESAGGYMAAMTALTPKEDYFKPDCEAAKGVDLSVKAGALYYAPFDFTTFDAAGNGLMRMFEMEVRRLAHLKTKQEYATYKMRNSPVNYVRNSPPLILLFSNPDSTVPVTQAYRMIEALDAENRPYEQFEISGPGVDHGFAITGFDTPKSTETRERAVAYLDKYLKKK